MIEGGYWWLMVVGVLFAPREALGIWLWVSGHQILGGISIALGLIQTLGNLTKED